MVSAYDRVRDRLLLENFLVGLGYLEGFVFARVLAREVTPVIYNPSQEITAPVNLVGIAATTFIAEQKFGSSALNSTNLFNVSNDFHLYQVFFGVAPSQARVFIRTDGTEEREVDEGNWGTNSDFRFGYIDGFASPIREESPDSEIFIPPGILYELGVFNPNQFPVSPIFSFLVNRMNIAIIRDAALIQKILAGAAPARLATIGGLHPPKYNKKNKWLVDPIPLNASIEAINSAVKGKAE